MIHSNNKRRCLFMMALIMCLSILSTDILHARTNKIGFGGVGQFLPFHSAEFVRTLNRNASTDADAAQYNPAGLVWMKKDGLTIQLSNHIISAGISIQELEDPEHDDWLAQDNWANNAVYNLENKDGKYEGEQFIPIAPEFTLIYKMGYLALYTVTGPFGGSGGAKFEDGNSNLDYAMLSIVHNVYWSGADIVRYERDAYAELSDLCIGSTYGAAYAINNMFSASFGLRGVYSIKDLKFHVKNMKFTRSDGETMKASEFDVDGEPLEELDVEVAATGYCGGIIAGFSARPIDGLIVGLRYEYYTPMTVTNDTKKYQIDNNLVSTGEFDNLADGVESVYAFPELIGLGVSYMIFNDLRAEVSLTYILNKYVDAEGEEYDYNNGYSFGIGLEYAVFPKKLLVSIGYLYDDNGIKAPSETKPQKISNTYAGGITYRMNDEKLDLTLGIMYRSYVEQEIHERRDLVVPAGGSYEPRKSTTSQKINMYILDIALGATYRIDVTDYLGTGKGSGSSEDNSLKVH